MTEDVEAPPIPLVGIGASAGGLEALERFFRAVPPGLGAAFVVVQHLSPDYESVMDELLARCTPLPVCQVEDGVIIEANSVYIIPPGKELIVSGGRLLLTDKPQNRDLRLPIDVFFRSLAQDAGAHAICVVLSGTGSDGSRGVLEIHDGGGLVLCQTLDSAKFDGMPRSALDTGVVDLALAPEAMPAAIQSYLSHLEQAVKSGEKLPATGGAQLRRALELLKQEFGVDFAGYKSKTVGRRIERRIVLQGASNLSDYVERLEVDQDERNALYRDLLIGVTRFFRGQHPFEKLGREVIPRMVRELPGNGELRLWSAACATGEEAYSLAILVHEAFTAAKRNVSAKIFATDVHRASLDVASAGIYPAAALEDVSPQRRERYFTKHGDSYQVVPELRKMIVFAPHNVIADAPFTKLNLISCRNLLIYLEPPTQRKVLSLFLFGLKREGVLFVGQSENVSAYADEFEVIDERGHIYRKRRDIQLPPDVRSSLSRPSRADLVTASGPLQRWTTPKLLRLYDILLERSMSPSLLVNNQRELIHAFGGASRFLHLQDGRPSMDVLDMVPRDLKTPIAGALQIVRKDRKPVTLAGVRLSGEEQAVRVEISPLDTGDGELHALITLQRVETSKSDGKAPAEYDLDSLSADRISHLERELQHTRESLQATIEELETSNEELQAANEELVASNEELQSTNEELQSVNEELYTVNSEFQKKIQQLTELSADMEHLLSSMEVGTVFLDRELCIRKFTPLAAELFHLMPQDVGRSIKDFRHSLHYERLLDDIRSAATDSVRSERDVQDEHGNWFLLRILPYRVGEEVYGVVLTLIDVAALKEAEERVRKAVVRRDEFLAMLSHELRNPLGAIVNAAQLAKDGQGPDISRAIAIVNRQAMQMRRLLDDLLDVSRVMRNKITLRRETVDVRRLIDPAVEPCRSHLESSGLELTVDIAGEPLIVDADPARLQQVITNLLSNAIKYNNSGGHIWIKASSEARDVVIRVRDDGMGMTEDMLEAAFEPFVQSERGLSRSDGGMGVGLTLVRHIVEMHGGGVRAHSSGPGSGSEFVVRLPGASDVEVTPRPVRESVPIASSNGRSVLIVEDNDDHREMLAALLTRRGYTVSTAPDADGALLKLRENEPSVAILDIGLPGTDGYALARQLRAQWPELRLVALTGYGRSTDRERALSSGFDEHLVKPMEISELSEVLGRLFGGQS